MDPIIPFRWNIAKREQLGSLLDGEMAAVPDGYLEDLRVASAKVLARAGNSRLVFVGRSAEHFFDYLSGAFATIEDRDPVLLQFSAALYDERRHKEWDFFTDAEYASFLAYLQELDLSPAKLQTAPLAIRFVDLVATGTTFRVVYSLMKRLAEIEGADWNVVAGRIGFVGLTEKTKNSPNTFRWQQSPQWRELAGDIFVKNVSIPPYFYRFIGDDAEKVTRSYHRDLWIPKSVGKEMASSDMLMALRRSVQIFDLASTKAERVKLSRVLVNEFQFKEAWLRNLVLELKK